MNDIYVGRQTIYDRKMCVHAYELLFRNGTQNSSGVTQSLDGDSASSEVLLNTFMEIGLERIAGPHRVFVNLTRNLFLSPQKLPFPKDRLVLELLEDIPIDADLLEAVNSLSQQGYQLALDDYTFDKAWDPLLPLVDIVKVEVPALPLETIRQGMPKLRRHGLKLLAEKIETEAEYQQLKEIGFDYFQGYYFSRPKIIQGKRLDENQLVILRLISALNSPDVTIEKLEKLLTQDASLSYKILRFINSAAIALPRKVESIRQAVIFMGLDRIRAWASLLALSRQENKPQSHAMNALVRAHMCEALVTVSGQCKGETGFTVGLLSILDLLMDLPLPEIIKGLSLSDEISRALLKGEGPAGQALRATLAYEELAWERTSYAGVDAETITRIYLDACEDTFVQIKALTSND